MEISTRGLEKNGEAGNDPSVEKIVAGWSKGTQLNFGQMR